MNTSPTYRNKYQEKNYEVDQKVKAMKISETTIENLEQRKN